MPYEVPDALRELADLQRGVLSRGQVLSAGLSADLIKARLERRRWQRMHAGVYATFTGPPGRESALWAALLRAGSGAILSHQSAAELDRLVDKPTAPIHVTVPGSRRVTAVQGIVVHSRHGAERSRHPARLPPRTRIEETVLDLADDSDEVTDAIDWIARALGRRLTTRALLLNAVDLRARLRWRTEIVWSLRPERSGVHSALEYRYVRDVEAPHRLPRGKHQASARRNGVSVYRDVLYEEYALIVEIDGRVAHPPESRWRDIQRDNAAAASGALTLRYGYVDLTVKPCQVALQVGQVLNARGWPGAARPCSVRCPIGAAP